MRRNWACVPSPMSWDAIGSIPYELQNRLRLRLLGDPKGEWAWNLLSEHLESSTFAAT